MSDLKLSTLEITNLKSTWNKIQNKNEFSHQLYQNLVDSNTDLRGVFHNDESIIKHHSIIFGDCLKFIIDNVRDGELLDEFLYQFVLENQRWSNTATKYLEPMGNSVIETFKQFLGYQFNSVMELVWIKLYVFMANALMQFTEEINEENETSMEEQEIPPLNIHRDRRSLIMTTPPTPIEKEFEEEKEEEEVVSRKEPIVLPKAEKEVKQSPILDKFNSIEIDLKSNTKYKGFRRSLDVATSPIQVAIPKTTSFTNNISSSLKALLEDDSSDSKGEMVTKTDYTSTTTFDPRPKSKLRSKSSTSSINDKWSSSPEPETDDEEFKTPDISRRNSIEKPPTSLLDKIQNQQQVCETSMNAQSFGLKGLASIAEDDSDTESDSSKYSSGEKLSTTSSSTAPSDSRSSSLSLYHQRTVSTASDDFNFLPPSIPKTVKKQQQPSSPSPQKISLHRTYSTTSVQSATPSTTASVGFMKSSFILKNQIDQKQPQPPSQHKQKMSASPSVTSLHFPPPNPSFLKSTNSFQSANDQSFDLYNSFNHKSANNSSLGLNYKSMHVEPPKKQGFRQRLSSLFSGSKSSISQVSTTPSSLMSIDYSKLPKSNESTPTINSQMRSNNSYRRPQSVFSSNGGKTIKYGASTTDLTSMYSNESSSSGFSLFRKKNKNNIKFVPPPTRHTRKGNKYNVRKVPYNVFA